MEDGLFLQDAQCELANRAAKLGVFHFEITKMKRIMQGCYIFDGEFA